MLPCLLTLGLLLADAADEAYLLERLTGLAARYEAGARRQDKTAARRRGAVVREVAHLPFSGKARQQAGAFLALVVQGDSSYAVRALAARAICRVGGAKALDAMYRTLFGKPARSRRFALLFSVLPEALAGLDHADDLEWMSRELLAPAANGRSSPVLRSAGTLRSTLLALTLQGLGRARARVLAPEIRRFARAREPDIRAAAVGALVALDAGGKIIAQALADPDERVRAQAAAYPRLPLDLAHAAAADPSPRVRLAAQRGLAGRPPRVAIGPLIQRLREEDEPWLRLDLAEALNRITGKEFGTDADLWSAWWAANRTVFGKPAAPVRDGRTYFFDLGMRTRRLVFLIDVSASMSREDESRVSRLEYAARELERTVAKLPREARFVIVAFSSGFRRFPDQDPDQGTREDAKAAATWLRAIKPTGATNTYGALMQALAGRFPADTIVLLSDGNPYRCSYRGKTYSEPEQILAEVRRANALRRVHIHTVALLSGAFAGRAEAEDAAAAADFLRRLAAQNRGEFREIR